MLSLIWKKCCWLDVNKMTLTPNWRLIFISWLLQAAKKEVWSVNSCSHRRMQCQWWRNVDCRIRKQLRFNVRTFVFFFLLFFWWVSVGGYISPFCFWGRGSRKKWTSDTTCDLSSLFFSEQDFFSYLWVILSSYDRFTLHTPTIKRKKRGRVTKPMIYIGIHRTVYPLFPSGKELSSLTWLSTVLDQAYLIISSSHEEM